jgi:surfactin synthase thioesterase subunit
MENKNIDPLDWFLREPSPDAVARLFVMPYSGCGASMYRTWPQMIGNVEVCPIQLPGRENRMREDHFETYERLADDLAVALEPFLDRPYAFFGHCAAALPSYETILRLIEQGSPAPVRLFVSSQVAPHEGPYGRFLSLNDEELIEVMVTLMRSMGGNPLPDLMDLYLSILKKDRQANIMYKKDAPFRLPCPITAISWDRDFEVEANVMTGWKDCGETKFLQLEGEHYTFLQAPPALIETFKQDMEEVLAPLIRQ